MSCLVSEREDDVRKRAGKVVRSAARKERRRAGKIVYSGRGKNEITAYMARPHMNDTSFEALVCKCVCDMNTLNDVSKFSYMCVSKLTVNPCG